MVIEDDYVFVNLYDLLEEDSEEVLEIKSLYQREEEYSMFLGPVEFFIANYYYYENRKFSDVRLTRHLRNVKRNFDKDLEFFSEDFEEQLMNLLSCVLQGEARNISRHELKLVISYILWAIDNRKHMGDKRGYLKWICGFFGILDEGEKSDVDNLVEDYGRSFGKDEEMIRVMQGKDSKAEFSEEEIRLNRLDSEGFSGDDFEGGFWGKGAYIESIDPSSSEFKEKMKYFSPRDDSGGPREENDEAGDFKCRSCGVKIGKHNLYWHDGCCDGCFSGMMSEES